MIYANYSSTSSDVNYLTKSIESIYNDVDEINIYSTGTSIIKDNKINYHIAKEEDTNGRFYFLDNIDGFYFSCSDNIIYPPNYVKHTLSRLATYDIVTYGGRNYRTIPFKEWETSTRDIYSLSCPIDKDKYVQFPNSDAMAFHTNDFKISRKDFNLNNITDVILGCKAKEKGKLITCLKKPKNMFIKQRYIFIEKDKRKTIYVKENFKHK